MEDSADESANVGQGQPEPPISDALQPTDAPQEAVSSSTTLSPAPTEVTSAQEDATPTSQQPTTPTSHTLPSVYTSLKQSNELPSVKGTERPLEDAKSLAIAIENQDMMSRCDLEERLLKNLYAPVQLLQSEVRERIRRTRVY